VDTEGEDLAPRVGTLAWLQAQDVVEHLGVMVPVCHRIPVDASLLPADDSIKCRVVSARGERCKGTRLKAYGLCMGHAGGGGTQDLDAMRQKASQKQASLKLTRQLLGVGPRRSLDPRAAMRIRAAQRAQDLALAVVDGPLDADLGPLDKQRAALAAVDATFPLVTASLTLEIPDDPDDMDWQSMQRIALSLDS
jgi:hypothetical protein